MDLRHAPDPPISDSGPEFLAADSLDSPWGHQRQRAGEDVQKHSATAQGVHTHQIMPLTLASLAPHRGMGGQISPGDSRDGVYHVQAHFYTAVGMVGLGLGEA